MKELLAERDALAKALLDADELHLADESTIHQLQEKVAYLEEELIDREDDLYAVRQAKKLLEDTLEDLGYPL